MSLHRKQTLDECSQYFGLCLIQLNIPTSHCRGLDEITCGIWWEHLQFSPCHSLFHPSTYSSIITFDVCDGKSDLSQPHFSVQALA
jgi:hypothetical protein